MLSTDFQFIAVFKIKLVAKSGTAENPTFFCCSSIWSSVDTIPATPKGELPANRNRIALACLIDEATCCQCNTLFVKVYTCANV